MAIIDSFETTKRSGSRTLTEGHWEHNYTRTFQVVTSSRTDDQKVVLDEFAIQLRDKYQSGFSTDDYSFCSSVSAVNTSNDGLTWEVTVEYTTFNPAYNHLSPLDDLPEVSWGFAQFDEVVDTDVNGKPVVNTVGDRFDPAAMRDQSRPVLRVSRNEATYNQHLAAQFKDTINSDTFAGFDRAQVKVSNISASRQFNPLIGPYWRVDYEFALKPDEYGWVGRYLNQGFNELGSDGKPKLVLINSAPAQVPAMLDEDGHVIPPPITPDDVFYCEFDLYNESDFSQFGFDEALFNDNAGDTSDG